MISLFSKQPEIEFRKMDELPKPKPSEIAVAFPIGTDYSHQLRAGVCEYFETDREFTPLFLLLDESGFNDLPKFKESFAGVITWSGKDRWVRPFLKNQIPVVNCGPDWADDERVLCVYNCNSGVSRIAVEHFSELGLRHACFAVHDFSSKPGMAHRVDRFRFHSENHGLEMQLLQISGETPDDGLTRLLKVKNEKDLIRDLKSIPIPCGIFCESDYLAALICRVAKSKGYQIPEDFAILGNENEMISRFSDPPISTLDLGAKKVGYEAARVMTQLIRQGRKKRIAMKNDFGSAKLIVRESTGGILWDTAIERCYRHIQDNACLGVTVKDLEVVGGFSRPTLIKRFHQVYGRHPNEEIREIKFKAACQMLVGTSLTVLEISRECGFNSQTSFSNFFLRNAGCSASAYRKLSVHGGHTPRKPSP